MTPSSLSTRAQPSVVFDRLRSLPLERLALALAVGMAVSLLWLGPHLPMTDLPQHAAQVALWRDLLLGRSAWTEIVRINLLTPYLIGYGLTLPLAFVLPLETAVRLVLSAALIAFVLASMALRRRLGGDARLDWLIPVGWFGFAWQWGFYTFLVASPVAILFLIVVHRACTLPSVGRNALVVAIGIALLFAHGLLFITFVPVGGVMALWCCRRDTLSVIVGRLLPFAILVLVCLVFRWASAQVEGAMHYDIVDFGDDLWLRPFRLLLYVTNVDFATGTVELKMSVLLLVTPALLRCRLNKGVPLVPFVVLSILLMCMPVYAFQTGFLFHRFALFILPFYVLMFRPPAPDTDSMPGAWIVPILAYVVVLGIQFERVRGFAAEARGFDTVLGAAEPGKRALSLVFDPSSESAASRTAYLHFPLWYQADKGGFVDFNFAEFHPQIVRFRNDAQPYFTAHLGWHPELYDGSLQHAALYDYLFVRGDEAEVTEIIRRNACPLTVRAADHDWTLLQRGTCPVAP